jgi:hypothetical protein
MNYLAEWCSKHDPTLLTIAEELDVAGTIAMRHPLTQWSANFKAMQAKIKMVKTQIELAETDKNPVAGDRFVDGMSDFQEKAEEKAIKMEREYG